MHQPVNTPFSSDCFMCRMILTNLHWRCSTDNIWNSMQLNVWPNSSPHCSAFCSEIYLLLNTSFQRQQIKVCSGLTCRSVWAFTSRWWLLVRFQVRHLLSPLRISVTFIRTFAVQRKINIDREDQDFISSANSPFDLISILLRAPVLQIGICTFKASSSCSHRASEDYVILSLSGHCIRFYLI